MPYKLISSAFLGALALGLSTLTASALPAASGPIPASASSPLLLVRGGGGGHGGGGGVHFNGGGGGGHMGVGHMGGGDHHRHGRGSVFVFGGYPDYYYDDGYWGSSCWWSNRYHRTICSDD